MTIVEMQYSTGSVITIIMWTAYEKFHGIPKLIQNYLHNNRWTATMPAALICININNLMVLILVYEMS